MGVPILRGGRVLGVLVVQNRTPAPLHRGGGRDPRDHRHGARRAGGRRRAGGARTSCSPPRASACCRRASKACRSTPASPWARRCCTSRASCCSQMVADDPRQELQRFARRGRRHADGARRHAGLARCGRRRRASRRARDLSHVRRGSRLARAASPRLIDSGLTAEAAAQKVKDDMRAPHGADRRSLSARARPSISRTWPTV